MQRPVIIKRTFLAAIFILLALPNASSGLDSESLGCLGCHDAVTAPDVTFNACGTLPECDHPIGLDYFVSSSMNRGLRAPFSLNPAIRLVLGVNVGCGTCHVPYSQADHLNLAARRKADPMLPDPMLVMSNAKSELCLACHLK